MTKLHRLKQNIPKRFIIHKNFPLNLLFISWVKCNLNSAVFFLRAGSEGAPTGNTAIYPQASRRKGNYY